MLSFSDFSYSAATLEGNMFSQISLIVLIVPLLLALPALPQDASNKEDVQPTVLFVCEQGAAKSIIATAASTSSPRQEDSRFVPLLAG